MISTSPDNHPFIGRGRLLLLFSVAALVLPVAGCVDEAPKKVELKPVHEKLPPKQVPEYLKGTVFALADSSNKEPYLVSGYGLVVGLAGTGNSRGTPLAVRNYMVDEMVRHGFGSLNMGLGKMQPERILADPSTAIVEVYGLIPPGARQGQPVDVYVQSATGSETRSLARGRLYLSGLYVNGADPLNPTGKINAYIKAQGPVFVNPGYLGDAAQSTSAARASLRNGAILGGGVCMRDRPIWLRVRDPQLSIARAIEFRINQRFESRETARTQDEGIVWAFVPKSFNGDWEHFLGIAMHLYLNGSTGFAAAKARELAAEAVKPDAKLLNISYAWEGLADEALPFIRPLYTHPSPGVAYAAARAGACLKDAAGAEAILEIARTDGHPFQINAVKTIGFLEPSTRVDHMLTELLSVNNALVRVEAYKILVDHGAPAILARSVGDQFMVDRVFCDGPPLIYASRSGLPRIALFGKDMNIPLPLMFSAMDDKLTISTNKDQRTLVVFDRTNDRLAAGQSIVSRADILDLATRLGASGDEGLKFAYSDVVGVLRKLSEKKAIAASFMLQDAAGFEDAIENAPPIVEPDGSGPAGPSQTGIPGQELPKMPGVVKDSDKELKN
ncbi:MAG: flagellar basal body P-ring protein FlgI [Tepidisphaerales bacterium]